MISIEEFEEIYNLIPGEPEFEYPSLDALLSADLLDGLNLRRNWNRIQGIIASDSWRLNDPNDLQHLKQHYHRN